jgi:hypothetical protein
MPEGKTDTPFKAGGYPFYLTTSTTNNAYLIENIISSYFISANVFI